MLPGPEITVHIYVLFGILSSVQSCVFVQSQCPWCMRCQFLECKGCVRMCPLGPLTRFLIRAVIRLDLDFPMITNPWLYQQSPRELSLQQYGPQDADRQGFCNCWYLRTTEDLLTVVSALFRE